MAGKYLSYIQWTEKDGLHSGFYDDRQLDVILEMIAYDDTMTLVRAECK